MRRRFIPIVLLLLAAAAAQNSPVNPQTKFRRSFRLDRAQFYEGREYLVGSLDGMAVQLNCAENVATCNVPKPGDYWIVNLPEGSAPYPECVSVVLYEKTYFTSRRQPVGAYCNSDKRLAMRNTALTAEWQQPAILNGNLVRGSVVVSNQTNDVFDETVFIEAVNEVGKAFALGYQHFLLAPRAMNVPIGFDMSVPPGNYVLHADAIGEVAARNAIYRVHLESGSELEVTTF